MAKPKNNKDKLSFNEQISAAKKAAREATDELVKFSFKYITQNEKFDFNSHDGSYFICLLDRLKAISGIKPTELINNHSQALRAHPIDWKETTEKSFGLPAEEQLVDTPYQFSLSSNEHGRVHGFMIGNRFYIVWLDKRHKLYS